jgi:hypothetical protein
MHMTTELDGADEPALPRGSQREIELEAKLNKRTMWAGMFAFIAVTELIIMIEVIRQAG